MASQAERNTVSNGGREEHAVANENDALITSSDPHHPANHICSLCVQFYGHGWVTGTGGGISIKHGDRVYLAPSGVQKELMKPQDIFVMDWATKQYLRRPQVGAVCPWTSAPSLTAR